VNISKEVKVGLLAVIACSILYVGVKFLKGSDFFSPINTYYVFYHDIDGLTVSNPVVINGFMVGRVSKIKFIQDADPQIMVALEVDNSILLGENTIANLVNNDILGSKAISLEIGKISRPKANKDTLRGKVAEGITELLKEKAIPLAESLDTIFHNVNMILSNISGKANQVDNMTSNMEETSYIIKHFAMENERKISEITINLQVLTQVLSDPNDGIKPVIAKLNAIADSLQHAELAKTLKKADKAIDNLQGIVTKINEGEGSLGKLVHDDSLYVNLNKSAESLDRLLIDLRENPKRYVHFSLFKFR
jgi:phospholipid/cholesterol/gamma-HCH transport system substrate-binding protein